MTSYKEEEKESVMM